MTIKIDDNVPLPTDRNSSENVFRKMKVGQSCFFPGAKTSALLSRAYHYAPARFITRSVTEGGVKGVRIWRIK